MFKVMSPFILADVLYFAGLTGLSKSCHDANWRLPSCKLVDPNMGNSGSRISPAISDDRLIQTAPLLV
ncbi:MAG: hypothetical protein AAF439_02905 [Pseudomonadota bacterium]